MAVLSGTSDRISEGGQGKSGEVPHRKMHGAGEPALVFSCSSRFLFSVHENAQ